MPLSHGHGLIAGLLAPLAAGGLAVCAGRFSALSFPAWLATTRPTWYTAVPAMHRAILRTLGPGNPGVGTLRVVRSASAFLPPRLMTELEATLRVPVIEAYGMTEAAHQITSNPLPPHPRKPGSVGTPLGVELAVVDDTGGSLPPNHVGEVLIRGRTVSRGVTQSGEWFRTGDLGYLDQDRYLFLVGRRDEMIDRGGEKVAPVEVDTVLLAHPAVADAVTVPQADPRLGEVVSALVVLHEPGGATPDGLREFVAARLAPSKIPQRIVLVSEIPREAAGKPARRRLAIAFGLDRADGVTPEAGGESPEARLTAFVAGWMAARGDRPPAALTLETSLVRSGLFDSLALVELAAWVEEETGGPLAPPEASRLAACDTVGDFAAFARARRGRRVRGGASRAPRPVHPEPLAGYSFAAYAPKLHAQILELQAHLWGPDRSVNAAYFGWKYERNPYLGEPLVYVACRDGKVVAMRGFFGARWEAGRARRPVDVLSAGDLVVAPAHRGRGLVPRLMAFAHADLAARGHRLAFNLSAGGATYLASLRTGWRTTPPLEPLEHRTGWAEATGPIEPAADPLAALDAAAGAAVGGAVAIAPTPRPGAMAELIASLPSDGRLRHVRDARYFAWRFENPLSRYRFLYWHEDRLEGYLVLQAPARARDARVYLVDWEARSPRVRAALLEAALRWGRFPDLRTWGATLDLGARRLLREHGFRPPIHAAGRPQPHASTVLVRALGSNGAGAWTLGGRRLLDLASWDLRMLYSDAI
jgi:acyl carrier protein